jgi:hypothetical protein
MITLVLFIILVVIACTLIVTTQDPPVFTEVKEKYRVFREYIANNPVPKKFKVLTRQIVLIGYIKKKNEIGYNTNKGYEIGLCLNGNANQVFHVLLHELSHSTVKEYEHNDTFWKNFKELREIAERIGIYTPITELEPFCGRHIRDT